MDYDAVSKAAQEFAAIVPSANVPPTVDASIAYFLNFDLWYGENVWKGPEVEAKEEWTAQTNPVAVAVGRTLNLSLNVYSEWSSSSPRRTTSTRNFSATVSVRS